ncbi:uncharacterized protein LOC126906765 isoform X2 [Daktulosphaira vitifoliae]|uniref:uncharacterized protein LOC126906765 isoform X2 n=1 Tax=Daktulosphaira vitifoliae TaxID=58002 RepID=UPI0021A9E368|nr:uncharacterized protein LOC126906765 isoform X2 [Daktulosphaira vitifoliae]
MEKHLGDRSEKERESLGTEDLTHVNNSMTVLKKNLEYEREKNNELQHEIEDKEVEINHLEKYREEKIVELSKKVLDQTNLYADLESKINTFVYTIEKKNKEENRIIKEFNLKEMEKHLGDRSEKERKTIRNRRFNSY